MNGSLLVYLGSLLTFSWGLAHLIPTKSVVRGFGDISIDNKRIITMEWLLEGISLMCIGFLAALVTHLDRSSAVAQAVYWTTFVGLNVFSMVSLATGFKNAFIAYKICPFVFTGSSIVILVGSYLP